MLPGDGRRLGLGDLLLPLPTLHAGMAARDVLGIAEMEDGRAWPVSYSAAYDQAQYRRWQASQRRNQSLEGLA